MATKKQKEELMQTLKFTPREYKIEIGAYGGEIYFGTVDRKIYEFFKEKKIDIEQWASDWDDDKWSDVPSEMRPFEPGSAYDCDNLAHCSGATFDSGNTITVYDENGDEVWSCELDAEKLEAEAKEWEERSDHEMHNHHRWAQATTVLQVCVALAAIALLTRKEWLKKCMYGVGGLGLILGAVAYFHI